jgi:hypothetical protein
MKKLLLCFVILLLLGCAILEGTFASSVIIPPDGFVEAVIFRGDVIDVKNKQISSKEELINYIDTAPIPITHFAGQAFEGYFLTVIANYGSGSRQSTVRLIVHINPSQNSQSVLKATEYLSGMPIIVRPRGWGTLGDRQSGSNTYLSEQSVILVKGDPEYWADSSFRSGDRTFTILPISDGAENAELRFTYTITKTTVEELERMR